MKFVLHDDYIAVFTNHEKESNHMGNIIRLPTIGWGFLACGPEQFITAEELEQIRMRVEDKKTSTE